MAETAVSLVDMIGEDRVEDETEEEVENWAVVVEAGVESVCWGKLKACRDFGEETYRCSGS